MAIDGTIKGQIDDTDTLYGISVLKAGANESSVLFALKLSFEGIERFQQGWDIIHMRDLKALINF